MRNILLFAAILSYLSTQAQFGPELVLDTSIYGSYINDIKLADMNNDNFLDVVVANFGPQSRISIYLNDNAGGFSTENVISNNLYSNKATGVGDFNSDGWIDIVALSQFGRVTMYGNNSGNSYTQVAIDSGAFFPLDIKPGDFNLDGFLDFVTLGGHDIRVYLNDSLAHFNFEVIADSTEFYSICTGDIDGDGFEDVISGSGILYTFINDGDGSFTRVTTNETLVIKIITQTELADMDGDGDLDLLLYYTNTSDKVDWFSNDGSGVFTYESTITSLANNIHDMSLGDIDNDNDIDLCLAYDQTGELVWIENLGNGSFSSEKVINSNLPVVKETALGDFDNDGDLDVCVSANPGFFYHLNQLLSTGIEEINKSTISCFPNPSSGSLSIETSILTTLTIFDASGHRVQERTIKPGMSRINLKLTNGHYVLRFISAEGVTLKKLIISQ